MNIFIVHSGGDYDRVKRVKENIEEQKPSINFLLLENGGSLWKIEATQLMRRAQMVLFLVGKNSYLSKNIEWELNRALKHNKLILCCPLDEGNQLNACLYGKDQFSKKEKLLAEKVATIGDIVRWINNYENSVYAVFNKPLDSIDRGELLEQYKVFLETSENLVERRQTVNSFYISANTALITIMSVLITMFAESAERVTIFALTGLIGIIVSASWNSILSAYGVLNASKIKVISMIEHELPVSLYDAEWNVMSDKLNRRKYVSFTDSEKRAPKAFIILYIALFLAAVVTAVFHFALSINSQFDSILR